MTTWDLWSHIRPSCCGLYNYDRTLFEPLQILKKLLKTPLLKPNHVQTKIIWPDSVLKKTLLSFVGQIEILALSKARVLISRTAPKISARDVTRKKSAFLRLRTSRGYTWCTETRVSSWAFRMDPPGIAMAKLPRSAMAAFAASATWNFWGKWLCHFFFLREGQQKCRGLCMNQKGPRWFLNFAGCIWYSYNLGGGGAGGLRKVVVGGYMSKPKDPDGIRCQWITDMLGSACTKAFMQNSGRAL